MNPDLPIGPKTVLLTSSGTPPPDDLASYAAADAFIRGLCVALAPDMDRERDTVHAVVVFTDLFVWATNVPITRAEVDGVNFIQKAILADWEFNAGIRPDWWPHTDEADRMWGVHYREDRANGRAELARMRLDRYDLRPLALTPPPPRDQYEARHH